MSAPAVKTREVYTRLLLAAFQARMDYRASFWAFIIALVLFYVAQFGVIISIVHKFSNIGNWDQGEVAFLYALLILAQGINSCFFSGLNHFDEMVRMGQFDRYLIRPLDPLMQIITGRFDPAAIAHLFMGLGALLITNLSLDIEWTWGRSLLLVAVVLSGSMIFAAIRIMVASVAFFTVKSQSLVHLFVFSSKEFLMYPLHIYSKGIQVLLTFFVPLAFINYYPAHLFLDKPATLLFHGSFPWLTFAIGLVLMVVARLVWTFGLNRYKSVGS